MRQFPKQKVLANESKYPMLRAEMQTYERNLHLNSHVKTDRKHGDYGFILALFCVAPALVVASAIFTPVGSEISNQLLLVGP